MAISHTYRSVVLLVGVFISCLGLSGQSELLNHDPKLALWKIGHKKEVVIVLHGGPCAAHNYLRPEFDRLTKVAQVVYYDQRGCGESPDAGRYTWQDHVEDLRKIIANLNGGNQVFLAGSSWGSALALLYAYHHPEDVKGLMLSGLFTWEGKGEDINVMKISERDRRRISNNYRDNHTLVLKEHQIRFEEDAQGELREITSEIEKVVSLNYGPAMKITRRSLRSAPVFEKLADILTPIIIFNGTQKCAFVRQVKSYKHHFPQGVYVEIKGACHDPWFADPEAFFDHAFEFIKKTKGGNLQKIRRYVKRKKTS